MVETLEQQLTAMTEARRVERDAATVQARFIEAMTCQAEAQQHEITRLRMFVGKVMESRRNYWRNTNEMSDDPSDEATLTKELKLFDPLYKAAEQALAGTKEGE